MKNKYSHQVRALVLSTILGFSAFNGHAQTVLINPNTDGGFEQGPTLADNGWTVVNSTNNNASRWFLTGTALTNGSYSFTPTGSRAAYASSDLGATWSYQTPAAGAGTSHFFKQVTFPAGETNINLSFRFNASGESTWDDLHVYLCPTTLTPVVNSPSGTSTVPAWTGTGTPIFLGRFNLLSAGNGSTVNLPLSAATIGNCSAATSWRIVFTWKNDGGGGTNPPAAVDDISLTTAAPGSITAAGGTFTINNAIAASATNFVNFTSAVNALNTASGCGLTGPVIFNVSAGQTFTEDIPAITASGSLANQITFQKSGTGANPVVSPLLGTTGTVDAVFTITGGDFITFDGINVNASALNNIEFGFLIRNASAINGATNNTIRNATITMNSTIAFSNSSAIAQSSVTFVGGGFTPTSALGANSNNKYLNLSISNAITAIYLNNASSTFLDLNTEVGTTDCSIRNSMTNLGPTGTQTFYPARGIFGTNQENSKFYNTDFSNIIANQSTSYAIYTSGFKGANECYNNKITNVAVIGSPNTGSVAYGAFLIVSTVGTNTFKIYNNTIANVYTSYTGAPTLNRRAIGLYVGSAAATGGYEVDNNSISIGAGLSPTYSSACFENSGSTCFYKLRGNIFANYTGAQTFPAVHSIWRTSAAASIGAESVSTYNDFYLPNDAGTTGFIAVLNTVNTTTIADMTAAITTPVGINDGCIDADPLFVNPNSDLHAQAIETNAVTGFTPQSWVTHDMDCQLRSSLTPSDLGADAYNVVFCAGTPDASNTLASVTNTCQGVGFNLSLATTYLGIGFSYQWQSSLNGTTFTDIAGANLSALTTTQTTATYYRCVITCTVSNLFVNSTPVMVGMSNFQTCYCSSAATSAFDTDIGNVTFGGINNGVATPVLSNTNANGTYSNFTALPTQDFALGTSYPVSISQFTSGSTFYAAHISMFIDYNQDGVFDPVTERVFNAGPTSETTPTFSGNVTIPLDALTGVTRMRVILVEGGNATSSPCGTFSYGETEDYNINIVCPVLEQPTGTVAAACAGSSVSLSATAPLGTLSWFATATGGTSIGAGATYATPVIPSSATYYVQADLTGCPSSTRDTLVVTMNPLPTVNAGADVMVCQGDTVTLNASGAVSYAWNNGATNATSFVPSVTTSYTVTGTGSNGCTNTDVVVVTVNALPNVNAGNDLTVCMNSQTVLSATGAVSYVWNNGITNNTLFFVTDTMTYTVTGTDANGCVNTDAVTVTPTALPLVNAGGSISQCGDQNVTLNATGAVSYVWNNGVANGASFTAPMGTSVYIVTGIDANGCSNVAALTVSINEIPTAVATAINELTMVASPANGAFQWIDCATNTAIAGAVLPVFTATENGSYAVIVTGNGGCADTSACLIVDKVSLENLNMTTVMGVYPNPTTGDLFISLTDVDEVAVTVMDAQGKVILTLPNASNGSMIDLNATERGVYLIHLTAEQASKVVRVVKN